MGWNVRTLLAAVCVAGAALGGCREERPTDANPELDSTSTSTTEPEQPDDGPTVDTPSLPDEPDPELREQMQSDTTVVLTVHPHGVTWVDGQLAIGPDLFMRLERARNGDSPKSHAVIYVADADATPIDAWTGFVNMLRQIGFPPDNVDLVFGGAGYEGLRPELKAPDGADGADGGTGSGTGG